MEQPPVKKMIEFTEGWWGQELDEPLVRQMAKAPFKHLESFRRDWPFHGLFCSEVTASYPELEIFDLPPLGPGELRPALRRHRSVSDLAGLALLLYSESVVLSSRYLAPFSLSGRDWEEREANENRRIVVDGFDRIVQIRPLVDRDLVYFTNLDATPPFRNYLQRGDGNWLLKGALQRKYPAISEDDLNSILGGSDGHGRILTLARQRRLSLVAQDDFEHGLFFSASEFAWNFLTSGSMAPPPVTPRHSAASTLARTAIPDLSTSTGVIAKLHGEEVLFAQWRESLHQAIGMIGTLRDDPDDIGEARVVLAKELDESTRRLRSRLAKSAALSQLTRGLRDFGVGASTVLLTSWGSPLIARALSAGLGGVAQASYGAATNANRKQTRQARLVDGIVFDFRTLAGASAPKREA